MRILTICNRAIEYLFSLLFFLVPLVFLPVNYELFEFNKMIFVYLVTILIASFWGVKMIRQGRISIQRTPLDLPILLFLISQVISTALSIDVHTSIWGYYSRFNGGLASIISYILLYYAFASNFPREKLTRLFSFVLASGALVAFYGLAERLGIDKNYWVQDVQNRVFSTFGQPNWLAAYLSILIPIALAMGLEISNKGKAISKKQQLITYLLSLITILFYTTLLFTKSRSGYLGLEAGLLFFITFLGWLSSKTRQERLGTVIFPILSYGCFVIAQWKDSQFFLFASAITLLIFISLLIRIAIKNGSTLLSTNKRALAFMAIVFALLSFLIGTPFEQLNRLTLPGLKPTTSNLQPLKPQGPALEGGGTESGQIRGIVWKGAIDIAKHYPFFGSGVETFAYSYYKFRPPEHNQTSEWDFLYNKAHNEYLNYLANTGFIGLGTYLLMIGWFLWITTRYLMIDNRNLKLDFDVRRSRIEKNKLNLPASSVNNPVSSFQRLASIGLLTSYISILVSNFFGFSVVVINLYFFLIPAFIFMLNGQLDPDHALVLPKIFPNQTLRISSRFWRDRISNLFLVFLLLISSFLLLYVFRMWDADRNFAIGRNLNKAGEYSKAYGFLAQAIEKRPGEPQFSEELSLNTASLAVAALEQNEATLSAQLANEAMRQSNYTIKKEPNNPSFWRTRIRVFYTLSQIDDTYNKDALDSAKKATELAPTDPKVIYNYALLLGQEGKLDEAIKQLELAVKLKPDYRDPVYALGLFYHEKATDNKGGIIDQELFNKAVVQMENVLKLASDDAEAKAKLKSWRGLP